MSGLPVSIAMRLSALAVMASSLSAIPAQSGADNKLAPLSHLVFDVASIREVHNLTASGVRNSPRSSIYIADNVTALTLVSGAYNIILQNRIENGPSWFTTARFTVSAKSDAAADEALSKLSWEDGYVEKRHMLQLLLADRFKLQIHAETRVTATYELVATERASRLMTPVRDVDPAKATATCYPVQTSPKGLEINAQGCPLATLLSIFQRGLGTDIADHTGMTGTYTYCLKFKPNPGPLTDEEQYPAVLDALREQLGLELKKTKAPGTFWVIDHIERPTEN